MNGGLKSIYDGCTQYKLGQPLQARRGGAAWPPLDACYFAYPNMQQVCTKLALAVMCIADFDSIEAHTIASKLFSSPSWYTLR